MTMTRRKFVQTAGVFTAASYNRIPGANNRVGVGFIGLGGRGTALLEKCFLEHKGVEPIAVCDVYTPYLERAVNIIRKKTGHLIGNQFSDFRHLLELKEADAVSIASPDHWHALQTIMACEAGKDVYLEKPISHSFAEEAPMIHAMQIHNRIVQVGAQQQSNQWYTDAVRIVKTGVLGQVNYVECWIYWVPDLNKEPQNPQGLNWDLWIGPAPYVEYDPAIAFFSWRYFMDYGGGKLTDWAPHLFTEILAATNAIQNATGRIKITAIGGLRHKKDHRDAPDDLVVTYDFGNLILVFKHAPWGPRETNHGIEFAGSQATLVIDRKNGYKTAGKPVSPLMINRRNIPLSRKGSDKHDSQKHVNNFIRCVQTKEKPVSSLENHLATKLAHLGNIAYKSGETVFVDISNWMISPAHLQKYLFREYRAPWKLNN